MANKIHLEAPEGDIDFEILEQTSLQGVNYILVTDAADGEDGECYVMKDISKPEDEEADYIFVEDDDELEAVFKIFETLMDGEDTFLAQ